MAQFAVFFVDFRKAFDLVDHKTACPYQQFSVHVQKPQRGNALGPLAFLVLIYDLSTGFPLGPLHKYVDDTTLSKLVQPKQLDTLILTYLADLYWLSSILYHENSATIGPVLRQESLK